MDDVVAPRKRKGRGAISNEAGRFEPAQTMAIDDGWGSADEELPPLATTFSVDATRTIIARNDSPDVGFDRSINPYRGCEHGCIYCFARPTHAFLGLSPGLDFETRIFIKPDAARLLAAELARPSYACAPIAMGTNTDPYQPAENRLQITRRILEVLSAHDHPVTIVTKSALIVRDLDILVPMAKRRLVSVALSLTTLDPKLARSMEPRAATPARRLTAMRALSEAGVPVGIMTAPMIPALNDSELETLLEAARAHGARTAGYVLLRLPLEIKGLFTEWLETHVPDKAKHVLNLIRDTRGGALYDSRWGERMRGNGAYAEMLRVRFDLAVKRLGFDRRGPVLDTTLFKKPRREDRQLSLL